MTLSIPSLLSITAGTIGTILIFFFLMLKCAGLFNWTTAGFWAWASFALYFVMTPLFTILSGELNFYEIRLGVSGGTFRGIWILVVAAIGISTFFIVYLYAPYREVNWYLDRRRPEFNPLIYAILIIFIFIGVYSLLSFRTGIIPYTGEKLIERGRFVGDITGYQYIAHQFLFVPIILLLLSNTRFFRGVAWLAVAGYCFLSLPHAWSRYITVSMVVALSIAQCVKFKRLWPKTSIIAAIMITAMVLQIRGHVPWDLSSAHLEFSRIIPIIFERNVKILGGVVDTAMLGSWYAESALRDTYTGYDYGLPLLNYILTGWIPYRFFSQKYFLIDWLKKKQGHYPEIYDDLLYGAKSTLIGSFYNSGGIVAVIFGMGLAGFLSRRLDGMLSPSNPKIVQAVGIVFLSVLWMVWGSSKTWGVVCLGTLSVPGLFVWLASRKKFKNQNLKRIHLIENHKLK